MQLPTEMPPAQELTPIDLTAAPISSIALSIPLVAGTILPSTGYPLIVAIGPPDGEFDGTTELVWVSSGTNPLIISQRGVNGTVAKNWPVNSIVGIPMSALHYQNVVDNILFLAGACQLSLVMGTVSNVQDGVPVPYSPGGTPRMVIPIGISPGNDGTRYNLPPTLQSFTATEFTVNIKTNTGDPGNPMTITWIAVL